MSQYPRVSVVMGAYNSAPHLVATVESILQQTYTDFEFIIIDDGSTDSTWSILEQLAARDARIVLHRNPANLGISTTRNLGTELARGEFIAVMDHDDISLPERLGKQVAFFDLHLEIGALGGQIRYLDPGGLSKPVEKMPAPGLIAWAMCFGMPSVHSACMVRRSLLLAVGGYNPNYQLANDYDLWFRLGQQTRLANLSDIVLYYRRHGDNNSFRRYEETACEAAEIGRQVLKAEIGAVLSLSEVLQLQHGIRSHATQTESLIRFVGKLASHMRQKYKLTPAEWKTLRRDAAYRILVIARHHTPRSAVSLRAFCLAARFDRAVAIGWVTPLLQKSARYRFGLTRPQGASSQEP
ncbi:MAG: glycosyltransferase [Caldilineaceae bacterium]|nr:glycosyltransferase [Caldilineaceae bacterium]